MSEWKESTLGDELIVQRGHDLPKVSMVEGQYPVCSSSGILGYHNAYTHDGDGLTIGRSGHGIGKVFYYQGPFWAHNTVLYVKDFKGNFPKFFYYFLKNLDFTTFNTGSAIPSLNRNHLYLLNIKLPVFEEQKAIASVLSSLDDKIDLLYRQNKTLEAMAETLFRQWFIEEAKEDWEDADLTQLITLQSGYAFKSKDFQDSGNFGVIKIKNISGNIIDIEKTDFVSDDVGLATAQRFYVLSGQVLIAMTGAEIGKLGLVPKTSKKLLLNQRVGLLKPNFEGAEYLAYLHLKSEFGQDYIENSATGSAQPNISGSLIEACPFPKLENSFLQQCGQQVQVYYSKAKENLGQIQTLEKLRDTLLPKLMSGEVRVQYQTEEVA